jgi:hypothetical protein
MGRGPGPAPDGGTPDMFEIDGQSFGYLAMAGKLSRPVIPST